MSFTRINGVLHAEHVLYNSLRSNLARHFMFIQKRLLKSII